MDIPRKCGDAWAHCGILCVLLSRGFWRSHFGKLFGRPLSPSSLKEIVLLVGFLYGSYTNDVGMFSSFSRVPDNARINSLQNKLLVRKLQFPKSPRAQIIGF